MPLCDTGPAKREGRKPFKNKRKFTTAVTLIDANFRGFVEALK
jgi:hypothetical protein